MLIKAQKPPVRIVEHDFSIMRLLQE